MAATQTQRMAYREFVESGRIKEADAKTLALIEEYGPGTAREIYNDADPDMVYSTFQPGCTSRLPEAGLVIQVDQRECRVTGKTAKVWHACVPDGSSRTNRDEDETRREKRDRLVRNDRVRRVANGRWEDVYEVDGDTETYLVTVDPHGVADCHCKWSTYKREPCSHEMAAVKMAEAIKEWPEL